MSAVPSDIAHHAALDARMAKAARGVRLLSLASWPASEQQVFLADLARGNPKLPAYQYPKHDFSEARAEFDAIAAAADPAHPLGIYLVESAHSWALAAELLENLGTPRVTELSVALFGKPEHVLPGGATTREAANHFIAIANELDHELLSPAEQVSISATSLWPAWKAEAAIITMAMLTRPATASAATTSMLENFSTFFRSPSLRTGARFWVRPECR